MPDNPPSLTRILVITHDRLGQKMAGPAIRALEMARVLHTYAEVSLVSVNAANLDSESFPVKFVTEDELRDEVASAEVVIFQGFTLQSYPWIAETDVFIVADLYDPMNLEILEQNIELTDSEQAHVNRVVTESLTKQLERADFMICASDKQRDFWLGHLASLCRVDHLNYRRDPSLRKLIDVVPFGIQNEDPITTAGKIKGVVPGISKSDKVIIWGGGIYNWFDPLTLIRAVNRLSESHKDIRLFFLGAQHPNPDVPAMKVATDAHNLAKELNLLDSHVFFHREWVPYEERADYLLDADLGVSTHYDHVETAFSFRTRILDYFWAGLPTVCTQGDSLSALIDAHSLGLTVPPENEELLAKALQEALYGEVHAAFRQNIQEYRGSLRWQEVLRPLIEYCQSPDHAADYVEPVLSVRERERQNLLEHVQVLAARSDSLRAALDDPTRTLKRVARRAKRMLTISKGKTQN